MTNLYQAEKETEAKHQADDNRDLFLRYQAETKEDEAKHQPETGSGTDCGQAKNETEAKYQAESDRNNSPLHQPKTEAKYQDEAKYYARTGAGTNFGQAGKETEAKYHADDEAKHQADNNKNLCLRYQAKTEAKYQADGDRNDWPLYQTEADDKLLLQLNNEMTKAAPAKVARHRNKVQDHSLIDEHPSGKAMPCGNASCHAAAIEDLDEEERERLMVVTGGDNKVVRDFIANMPPAQSLEVLKEVAERDTVYQGPKGR